MRILLDECVPRRLRQELAEHEVRTVPEMGWASFKNRVLLAAASGKFDVLVTTDQRLSYEHSVSTFAIAAVVLVARRNKLESLLPLVPELRKVLEEVKLGEVRRVGV
jgi:predicted nuclease of predicted toxin-antitoxin system